MSQPLAGAFTALGEKTKDKARRHFTPGPEWKEPLLICKIQMGISGFFALAEAGYSVAEGNPVRAANSLFNGWQLVKGIHNYNISHQSAEQAPLRDLLGDAAPANDNLLTPQQSLSNSCALISRTFASLSVATLGNLPYHVREHGVGGISLLVPMTSFIATFTGHRLMRKLARNNGPTRMPSITGKLPGVS